MIGLSKLRRHPMHDTALFESRISSLELLARGKVRDIYAVDEQRLLIVTTDRLSAYDVVMPDPVPGKGRILTELSNFWFGMMQDLIPNHLLDDAADEVVTDPDERRQIRGRSVVVRRLEPLPIEAVVRGYLIGSGWRDYQATGAVCGHRLREGLEQAERLDTPLFTPATKAAAGDHDENIDFEAACSLLGFDLAGTVRDVSLGIYTRAAAHALERGIVLADTKLEFGLDREGTLYVIDEMLTPDSSRFWPLESYRPGTSPESYDKQFVRDYLDTLDWDRSAPGPSLPAAVIERTREKYAEALRTLTAGSSGR